MGQDRVRPLALALQGLDYTVGGQTVGGGRKRVCVEVGWGEREGEFVVEKEGWIERELEGAVDVGDRGDRGGTGECSLICQQEVRLGGDVEGWLNTAVRLDWIEAARGWGGEGGLL